jgi:carbamoyl-phosphate synthase small subunit
MDIAKLALEDGTVFTGRAFGARGEADGEVVFNTSMTGYQEILTDPSYHGQIVAMTYPLIGNYGVNAEDAESRRPWVRGFVVRELSRLASNHRASGSLDAYLAEHGIIGIEGIDTRRPGAPDPRAGGDEGDPLDDRPGRCGPGGPGPGQPPGWSAAT